MKNVNGGKVVSLLAVGVLAAGNVMIPAAIAQESSTTADESSLIAQGLIGQCRLAKRPIFIYSERSTGSRTVRALALNERVTLAGQGANGWIAVSAPTTGFVQTADLKLGCDTTPQPPKNLCRQLKVDMNVRQQPNTNGRYLTTLRAGRQVTLKTGQEIAAADGRFWVEISSPTAGWISSRPSSTGEYNYTDCTGNPPSPPPTSSKTCRVAYPEGLRTWNAPAGTPIAPGVRFNQVVTLTGERRVIGNRVWVQISSPVRAWISSGFVGSELNLTPSPCR